MNPTPALKSTFQKSRDILRRQAYTDSHSRVNVFGPEPGAKRSTTPVKTPLPTANVAFHEGRTSVFSIRIGAGKWLYINDPP